MTKTKKTSNHYSGSVEPIELIESMGDLKAFCRANIIKYIFRYQNSCLDDLYKARDYLDILIYEEKENK